jgi:hypothetical protein
MSGVRTFWKSQLLFTPKKIEFQPIKKYFKSIILNAQTGLSSQFHYLFFSLHQELRIFR